MNAQRLGARMKESVTSINPEFALAHLDFLVALNINKNIFNKLL